jgi:hypothetical protein
LLVAGIVGAVSDDEFTIKLTRDQALVLSDWLHHVMSTAAFGHVVNQDRAVWSQLHRIAGSLEGTLTEIFMSDYSARLDTARNRLLDTLGELGRTIDEG